jgi:hypothetical protein
MLAKRIAMRPTRGPLGRRRGGRRRQPRALSPAPPPGGRPPPPPRPGGRQITQEDLAHPALKYGMPQTDHLRFFSGFVSCFDSASRNPKWVLEYVSKDTLGGEGTR